MNFDQAFDILIDPNHEGGFSMDPHDPGNWTGGKVNAGVCKGTKFGISAASYPALDIANLSRDDVKPIYQHDYWGRAGCDFVPDPIKYDLFDMAVNSGQGNAIRTLQRAVGANPDGVFGQETAVALSSADPVKLHAKFNGARLHFLTQLDDNRWVNEGRGLINRVGNNLLMGQT